MNNKALYKRNTWIHIIKTDKALSLSEFSNFQIKNSQKALIMIIGAPHLNKNWFTETSWWMWKLWNFHLNIPIYNALQGRLEWSEEDTTINEVISVNYHLIRNYFRNHILLWNAIRYAKIWDLKEIVKLFLQPLIDLIEKHYQHKISLQEVMDSKSILDIAYETEKVIQEIWYNIDNKWTEIIYQNEYEVIDRYINNKPCLQNKTMKWHRDILKKTIYSLNPTKEEIKSILIYWSIATNKATSESDLFDWIAILNKNLLKNKKRFQDTFSRIIDANKNLLDNKEIKHTHPFHYMFESDLDCIIPYFKKSFEQNYEIIHWEKISLINWLYNDLYDTHYWKYMFFNLYQKILQEFHIIRSQWLNDDFLYYKRELGKFMRNTFILCALSTKGIFTHENETYRRFCEEFSTFSIDFESILNRLINLSIDELNDLLFSIIDLYAKLINHIYIKP